MTTPCQAFYNGAIDNLRSAPDVAQTGAAVNQSGAIRKVVQIVEVDRSIVALCDDGSIWGWWIDKAGWQPIAPPPGCGGGA